MGGKSKTNRREGRRRSPRERKELLLGSRSAACRLYCRISVAIPSMLGTIDCLSVRCAALVTVSSLTAIFLFQRPMAVDFSRVQSTTLSSPAARTQSYGVVFRRCIVQRGCSKRTSTSLRYSPVETNLSPEQKSKRGVSDRQLPSANHL